MYITSYIIHPRCFLLLGGISARLIQPAAVRGQGGIEPSPQRVSHYATQPP